MKVHYIKPTGLKIINGRLAIVCEPTGETYEIQPKSSKDIVVQPLSEPKALPIMTNLTFKDI